MARTLLIASLVQLAVQAVAAQDAVAGLERLKHGFIVEYEQAPEIMSSDPVQDVTSQVAAAIGVEVAHNLDLRSSIFNGASFKVVQTPAVIDEAGGVSDDILESTVLSMPAIKAIYPNGLHELQAPAEFSYVRPDGVPAPLDRRQTTGNTSQIFFGSEGSPLLFPHAMTGVDRLHAEGLTGQGIKVAVIDSGIDAFHPALGGGYGPGFKVAGGYDFVGDLPNNVVNPPAPDDSPITTCSNHGTAVSGIVAGLPYKFGFVGVAPNATIYHYKVFPCSGTTRTDIGVNASLTAYNEGVDVINASIGSQGGWPNDLWAVIAARIMANGTAYMISAGNNGGTGPFFGNSLSSRVGVPSIGSIDNAYASTLVANGSFTINDAATTNIQYAPGFPANWTSPLEIVNLAVNGCTAYPNMTFAKNQVVLLPRPWPGTVGCDQLARAEDANVSNLLIYNYYDDVPTRALPVQTTEGFPFDWLQGIAYIDRAIGLRLAELVAQGNKVTVDLPWKPDEDTRFPRTMENTLSGGFMSNFSTWGPTYETKLGTTVSAPGGLIMTLGAELYGGLVIASGTSFSSPYTAGVAALMREAHPGITGNEIMNRLATTAKPVRMQSNQRVTQDYLSPPFQQGGGLIDAYAAVHTTTTFNVSELAFNDTAYLGPLSFEMRNEGNESVTYEISHSPGPTLYTFAAGNNTVTAFSDDSAFPGNVLPDVEAAVSLSQSSVTLDAGSSAVITVTVTPPGGLDARRVPLYSGFLSIAASNGDALSIPYGGVGSELRQVPVLDTAPGQERTFLIANTTSGNVRPGLAGNNLTSTFVIPRVTGNVTTSTLLTNITLPGFSMRPLFGSLRLQASLLQDGQNLGQISTVAELSRFYVRDATNVNLFYGRMADGTFVQDSGIYRFQVRLLRVTGNPDVAEDWDEVVTEPFTIIFSGSGGNGTVARRHRRSGSGSGSHGEAAKKSSIWEGLHFGF